AGPGHLPGALDDPVPQPRGIPAVLLLVGGAGGPVAGVGGGLAGVGARLARAGLRRRLGVGWRRRYRIDPPPAKPVLPRADAAKPGVHGAVRGPVVVHGPRPAPDHEPH